MMNIGQATIALKLGRSVKRAAWKPWEYVCSCNNRSLLRRFDEDGPEHEWDPGAEDVFAEDWDVVGVDGIETSKMEVKGEMASDEREDLMQRLREAYEEIGLLRGTRAELVAALCFTEREWFRDFSEEAMRRLEHAVSSAQIQYKREITIPPAKPEGNRTSDG
jgi:hypothetical protein